MLPTLALCPTLFSMSLVAVVPVRLTGPTPAMKPGPARPWHTDVQVSTYSHVDLFHGNMFTAIPIVSWSGTGPDMNFMLYHNSANWDHTAENTKNVGFFLGPGWTISYSDHILDTNPKVVIRDDGTRDSYTWNGTKWVAPTGVYDELEQDQSNSDIWRLRHKDQSYHEFSNWLGDGVMRLEKIVDATGNSTVIEYGVFSDPLGTFRYPITRVRAAGGGGSSTTERCINFHYDVIAYAPYRALARIDDPGEQNLPESGTSIADRSWYFYYDTSTAPPPRQYLNRIQDPMNYHIHMAYGVKFISGAFVPVGRLKQVSDKTDVLTGLYDVYLHYFAPSGAAVKTVDPVGGLYQEFTFSGVNPGYYTTQYRDRRASIWTYRYNDAVENLFPDGNLNRTTDPTGVDTYFYHYDDRNTTDIYDDDGNHWYRIFDAKGNLLWSEDPLGHFRFFEYDTYNNLKVAYDPVGNSTRYCYEKIGYPTLLTKIIEPDDSMSPSSPGNCAAIGYPTTTMDYYAPGNGQLKDVIDPNGVWTNFEYDMWGQLASFSEGIYSAQTAGSTQTSCGGTVTSDGGGNLSSSDSTGGSEGHNTYDAAGNSIGSVCKVNDRELRLGAPEPPSGFPALPCDPLVFHRPYALFDDAEYSPRRELLEMPTSIYVKEGVAFPNKSRHHSAEFDALGRQEIASVSSNEMGTTSIPRTFSFGYTDWATQGKITRIGPDGTTTTVQMNAANRVTHVERKASGGAVLMSAAYAYNNLGQVTSITYGNNASTIYTYDDAGRTTAIDHKDSSAATALKLTYTYTNDDLPLTIAESGSLVSAGTSVTFTYDKRRRLTQEVRVGTTPYNISYTYDKGGNRKKKIESHLQRETWYFYDVDPGADHSDYRSKDNRLEYYTVFDTSQAGLLGEPGALVSTTWYYYQYDELGGSSGNVERIVTKPATGPQANTLTAVRFGYARNARTATYVISETWTYGATCPNDNYAIIFAKEFRYDSARARYLNRSLDPAALMTGTSGNYVALSSTWSDYDGDDIHSDFTVVSGVPTTAAQYEPGLWSTEGGSSQYVHDDHLGTLRLTTNSSGVAGSLRTFTAFGERLSASQDRFGYVGTYGYQAHAEMPYLHLGHRYFDPTTGRFLQRDPIGIKGDTNVYAYVSQPTLGIDPSGLQCRYDHIPPPGVDPNKQFLIMTGGEGETFFDRWGDIVGGNSLPLPVEGGLAGGGMRLPKGMKIPGTRPSTTSIWTKVPGISLPAGRLIGRVFLPLTILGGAYDLIVLGCGAYEAW